VRAKTKQLGLEVDKQQAIRRKIERMGLEVVVVPMKKKLVQQLLLILTKFI